jgi:predicted Zn finger-like uncharacterized protein
MYADCPSCHREFIVRAHHLAAANGQVRCGFCGVQFDALPRLHDVARAAPLPPESESALPEEAAADLPGEPVGEPPPEATAEPRVEFDGPEPEFDLEPQDEPLTPRRAERREPRMDPPFTFAGIEPAPAPFRALWLALGVVLLLAAAGQLAWFNRDLLIDRYPQLLPLVERLCDRLSCTVIRYSDYSRIRLLNRDVRLHPRFDNALLVNVTLANDAPRLQPFPRLQLVLRNVAGEVVAQRVFAPAEYLDGSIDVRRGMVSGVPVHVALELAGAGAEAVSFEFGFL